METYKNDLRMPQLQDSDMMTKNNFYVYSYLKSAKICTKKSVSFSFIPHNLYNTKFICVYYWAFFFIMEAEFTAYNLRDSLYSQVVCI